TTLHEAINMARELVEQVVQGKAARKTARAYVIAPAEGKVYAGNLPKCNRYNLHNHGPCPLKCQRSQRMGHMERDYRARLPGAGDNSLQNVTCFGCGEKGYCKNRCPRQGTIRLRELMRELTWWLKIHSKIRMSSRVRFYLMITMQVS
ncbi:hypothetical protein Tco_0160127, partial [Tanacetum coccineum]